MIALRTPQEIAYLRQSGNVVAELLLEIKNRAKQGISTRELDSIAEAFLIQRGARPAFKGYHGYPCTLCTSINDEVVHGIPSKRELREGDILSVDAGAIVHDYYGDAAITIPIGKVSREAEQIIKITEEALHRGIAKAQAGNFLSDISHAIQTHAEKHGFSLVRDFVGHGIGQQLHEDPQIPNYGAPGNGPRLKVGMVLAIEPMVNQGDWKVVIKKDKWTAVTADGKLSAHFEHTLAITENGPEILTRLPVQPS